MLLGKGEEGKKSKRQLQVFIPNAIQHVCSFLRLGKSIFIAEENVQISK